jgi:hypothetical protein
LEDWRIGGLEDWGIGGLGDWGIGGILGIIENIFNAPGIFSQKAD